MTAPAQPSNHAGRRRTEKVIAVVLTAIVAAAAAVLVPQAIDEWQRDDTPYDITVDADPDLIQFGSGPAGGEYVVERPIDEVGAPPGSEDNCVGRYEWARSLGAVPADISTIRFTLSGTTDEPVTLTGIDVVVLKREAVLSGVNLSCPGRGADVDTRFFAANLTNDPPITVVTEDGENPVEEDVHYQTERGDPLSFIGRVTSSDCDCEWVVDVRLRVGDRKIVERIDDDGRPFRTTSSVASPPYRWRNGQWVMGR